MYSLNILAKLIVPIEFITVTTPRKDELNKVPLGLGRAPGPRQRTAGLKLSLPEGQGFELSILLPSRKRS
ncbi:hypothetical protein PCANC_19369 [Puccinia coronata f. sp. avenae]|uniref:Uncharacterized protein n=1 Tax=Puccinia coronata f. sp. avenae TaxID=200324 RepID=A0A2N5UPH0_9BASI|nr:hypothetical protein PCANC_19369 [Puccinia coronata f. sp. avenae]